MDDFALAAFACFLLLAVLASPIALWLTLRWGRRMRALERTIRDLDGRVATLGRAEPAPPRAPEPAPLPVEPETEARAAPEEPALPVAPPPTPPEEHEERVAARPAPAPSRPSPLEELRRRLRGVDWERWIGVRGAAVVGGVLLALAAILFFRHAFARGWITPPYRVGMGVMAGLACIAGGWRLRGRGYAVAPSALQGAGVVALYAAIYAADKRYHMLSVVASFPLMAVVTALACVLAVRHRSRIIALLGLVGGFTTPLLLATDTDQPIALFGYILLLDLGLFLVGRKRGWASIGFLALLGTFLIESLWIFGRMGEERVALGICIVAVFAALFALFGAWIPAAQRRRWFPAQAGGVLFPFVFAIYFSDQVEFRGHVWPNALLLGLLAAAGCVLGRAQRAPWLSHGAASAGVAVVAVWFFQMTVDAAVVWELSAVAFGLALVPHAFAEWELRRDGEPSERATSASLAAIGWALLLVIACLVGNAVALPAPLAGLLGVSLLLVRQAWLARRGLLVVGAGGATGLGLALHYVARQSQFDLPPVVLFAIPIALALGLLALGIRTRATLGRFAWHGVGALLVPVLLALPSRSVGAPLEEWLVPTAGALLAIEIALAAALLGSRAWLAAGLALALWVDLSWTKELTAQARSAGALLLAFLLLLVTAAVLVSWPTAFLARFRARPGSFVAPALALAVWSAPLAELYAERFGDALPLMPFLLLAGIGVASLSRLRRDAGAVGPLAWIGGATAFLLAAGLAEQIDHEPLVVGGALWCLGLATLARWIPHRGPAWLAAVLAIGVGTVVSAHAFEPGHYLRSEDWLLNAISTVHLIPAACLLGVALLLRRMEPGSGRWSLVFRTGPGLALVVTIFAWINLEILNFYGRELSLSFAVERLPQRDLTLSLAWGIYALVLLSLGTWKRVMALRWTSLTLFLVAIGKVFLHDLGHLEGLYRVGSLAGLAVSLFAVSLFYQRFVFGSALGRPAAPEAGGGA